MLLFHFVPPYPSLSPCPQVHSPPLCLYSCPAPRFFRSSDLPGPGLEPVSPALAGGFLNTVPRGKP